MITSHIADVYTSMHSITSFYTCGDAHRRMRIVRMILTSCARTLTLSVTCSWQQQQQQSVLHLISIALQ